MSSPPLCEGPDCQKPVKRRVTGPSARSKRPPRIIDGIRWGWFCSARCAARARNYSSEHMHSIAKQNHLRCQRRILARLVAACKDVIDENGKVDPKDMVRVMMLELRGAYQRQYQADQRFAA